MLVFVSSTVTGLGERTNEEVRVGVRVRESDFIPVGVADCDGGVRDDDSDSVPVKTFVCVVDKVALLLVTVPDAEEVKDVVRAPVREKDFVSDWKAEIVEDRVTECLLGESVWDAVILSENVADCDSVVVGVLESDTSLESESVALPTIEEEIDTDRRFVCVIVRLAGCLPSVRVLSETEPVLLSDTLSESVMLCVLMSAEEVIVGSFEAVSEPDLGLNVCVPVPVLVDDFESERVGVSVSEVVRKPEMLAEASEGVNILERVFVEVAVIVTDPVLVPMPDEVCEMLFENVVDAVVVSVPEIVRVLSSVGDREPEGVGVFDRDAVGSTVVVGVTSPVGE